MDKHIESIFKFLDYKVDSIEFLHKLNTEQQTDINFELQINIDSSFDQKKAIVTLIVEIKEKEETDNYPFNLKVSVSGLFTLETNEEISEETFTKYCKFNGTTALFPFLRSTIADITRLCNVSPFILPLINVANIIGE